MYTQSQDDKIVLLVLLVVLVVLAVVRMVLLAVVVITKLVLSHHIRMHRPSSRRQSLGRSIEC